MSTIQLVSEHGCFGGVQRFYKHDSRETRGPMKFSVYLPPQSRTGKVPVLYYLSGLTCTEETFPIKAHAQQTAAELGLMLVAPDTSPREPRVPGDADSWDFGQGAGFYVDATQAPWSTHYRMYSYVTRELPELVARASAGPRRGAGDLRPFDGRSRRLGVRAAQSVALQIRFRVRADCRADASARGDARRSATISARTPTPGASTTPANWWRASPLPRPILIDQGTADQFLTEQLLPEKFAAAAAKSGQPLDAANAAGLRSRLLFHSDLHGRSSAAPRRHSEEMSVSA